MRNKNLSKEILYESVRTLIETKDPHIHLPQHKLYTLFSVAFQYFLFKSTKNPGAYILRIEDHYLCQRMARKAKDDMTRTYMERILLPRKMNFQKSQFYLDYFHFKSWGLVNEIPPEQIKGALIVHGPEICPFEEEEEEETIQLPKNYYYTSLQKIAPETIVIGHQDNFENTFPVEFPFITKEEKFDGVTLSSELKV